MPELPTPDPPETLSLTVTPAQALARFERLREHYRMGILDLAAFNSALALYRFPDAQGVLWTVGATSNRWYRWDGKTWQPGDPPSELQLPAMPLDLAPEGQPPVLARQEETAVPVEPSAVRCPKCGAANVGKKFCTSCGTKLG
jgi:hypothetical protein